MVLIETNLEYRSIYDCRYMYLWIRYIYWHVYFIYVHRNDTPIRFLRYMYLCWFWSIGNNRTSTLQITRFRIILNTDPEIHRNNQWGKEESYGHILYNKNQVIFFLTPTKEVIDWAVNRWSKGFYNHFLGFVWKRSSKPHRFFMFEPRHEVS